MTTLLDDITAVDWSPKLDAIGRVVENLDDISQCLRVILTTPRGSRPHEPLFGCDIWRYLDRPTRDAIPHIIREVVEAVTIWEPRVVLTRVMPDYAEAGSGRVALLLEWTLKDYDSETQTTRVNL